MANYHVSGKNGNSKIQKEGGEKASKANIETQKEAEKLAKQYSANNGGGEVSIHSEKGPIRQKDTVKPGNDPRDIKG